MSPDTVLWLKQNARCLIVQFIQESWLGKLLPHHSAVCHPQTLGFSRCWDIQGYSLGHLHLSTSSPDHSSHLASQWTVDVEGGWPKRETATVEHRRLFAFRMMFFLSEVGAIYLLSLWRYSRRQTFARNFRHRWCVPLELIKIYMKE